MVGVKIDQHPGGSVWLDCRVQIDFDPGNGTQIISGDYDAFFAKYNANGVLAWLRQGTSSQADFLNDITVDNASGSMMLMFSETMQAFSSVITQV